MKTKIIDTLELNLLPRQRARLSNVFSLLPFISFISVSDQKGVWVESENELSQEQIVQIIQALQSLPSGLLPHEQDRFDFEKLPFYNITPAQAEQYVLNQVNDLTSAKQVLALQAKVIIYLLRKIGMNQQ